MEEKPIRGANFAQIATDGGAHVGNDVNAGRDVAGRDINSISNNYYLAQASTDAQTLSSKIRLHHHLPFIVEYILDYFWNSIETLSAPTKHYELTSSPKLIGTSDDVSSKGNSRLFGFVVINLTLGSILTNLILSVTITYQGFIESAVIISLSWVVYGSVIHASCKCVGGQGSYKDTLSVIFHTSPILHLVSCFTTLLFVAITSFPIIQSSLRSVDFLIKIALDPVLVYYGLNAVLQSVYLSIILPQVHKFGFTASVLHVGCLFFWISFPILLAALVGLAIFQILRFYAW